MFADGGTFPHTAITCLRLGSLSCPCIYVLDIHTALHTILFTGSFYYHDWPGVGDAFHFISSPTPSVAHGLGQPQIEEAQMPLSPFPPFPFPLCFPANLQLQRRGSCALMYTIAIPIPIPIHSDVCTWPALPHERIAAAPRLRSGPDFSLSVEC